MEYPTVLCDRYFLQRPLRISLPRLAFGAKIADPSGLCWRGTLYRPDSRPKVIHAIGRYLFRSVILLLVGIRRTRLRIDEGG